MASLTANLFLNTSGFTSGIDKAKASTSSYHREMSRAASSIKGLEGNIKVLQLQASGYDGLASSLKQTLAVEAQADKLAKSGLITREKAITLLSEQRLLESNIAAQKAANDAAQAKAAERSREIASAHEKARTAAQQYNQQIARTAEATAKMELKIRILEMEAAGYTGLAESMRQTMNIEAQAQKLANDGVMTKQKAIELLTKQSLLEKNVAAQKANAAAQELQASQRIKEIAADFERARSAAAKYNDEVARAATTMKSLEQKTTMLRMIASGHEEMAASMQRSLDIEARANKLASDGLMTKKQALAMLNEQALLERNIATQKENAAAQKSAESKRAALINNPRAAGLPQLTLTPEMLKQTERAGALAQESTRQFNKLTRGIGGTSMGFLAFSQAVEDAQYGIKGVLNNIPQMILGFGGSMGLAGAISLAAVAAVALYPKLKKLFGALDSEILKKASTEFTRVFKEGMKAAQAIRDNAEYSIKLKNQTAEIARYYDKIIESGQDMAAVHRANYERLQDEYEITEQIYDARDRLLKLQGKKDDNTIAKEKAEREIKNLEDQAKTLREEQDAINAKSQKKQSSKITLGDPNSDAEMRANAQDLAKLKEELAVIEANAAAAKKKLEEMAKAGTTSLKSEGRLITNSSPGLAPAPIFYGGKETTNKAKEEAALKKYESDIEAQKDKIKEAQDLVKADAIERQKRIDKVDAEIKNLDDLNKISYDEEKRLKQLIKLKKELLSISDETKPVETRIKQDEYNKAYDEEMKVLKARAAGDEKELQRLEYKRQLQDEINKLKKAGFEDDGKGNLIGRAKKLVDARINAEEPQQKAKPDAGGRIPQLGSVAKATNVLMGRAANDGILEENRRQTSLLRSLDKKIQPTKETTKISIGSFVFD